MVFIWGIVLIAVFLTAHLILWRFYLPKRQARALFLIFIVILTLFLCVSVANRFNALNSRLFTQSLPYVFHIMFFYFSFFVAYLVLYSAIEADSPTLLMLLEIDKCGSAGLTKDKLREILDDDLLIKPRLNDLLLEGLIVRRGNKIKLSGKGRLVGVIFTSYRKILNLPKGG
jgi:uncharacterized protein YacL